MKGLKTQCRPPRRTDKRSTLPKPPSDHLTRSTGLWHTAAWAAELRASRSRIVQEVTKRISKLAAWLGVERATTRMETALLAIWGTWVAPALEAFRPLRTRQCHTQASHLVIRLSDHICRDPRPDASGKTRRALGSMPVEIMVTCRSSISCTWNRVEVLVD